MGYIVPQHNLELTPEVILELLDHVAKAFLYLGISTREKVMILFLSHSLGIVMRTEQDLIACFAILHL
jgi:hypothetical protein